MNLKKTFGIVFALSMVIILAACDKEEKTTNSDNTKDTVYYHYEYSKVTGNGYFDFPGNYEAPELDIDGEKDGDYDGVPMLTYGHNNHVNVSVFRGEKALFFYFDVVDTTIMTQGYNNGDDVTMSDSIEIYLDTLNDGGSSPRSDDYQINIGAHGKARILSGSGGSWGTWNGLVDYAVVVDGSLNSDDSDDQGFQLELMIPYDQISITKDSDLGIALGHVNKVGPGSSPGKDFHWTGISYGGVFADPQIPERYMVYTSENVFYTRAEAPRKPITITGKILDKDTKAAVSGVQVYIEGSDITATTNSEGVYVLNNVPVSTDLVLKSEHIDYVAYQATITSTTLKSVDQIMNNDLEIINKANANLTTITGQVANVIYGNLDGVNIQVKGTAIQTTTNAAGEFTIEDVPVTETMVLILSKTGYEVTEFEIALEDIKPGTTEIVELIGINLNPTQSFPFGGRDHLNLFDTTITRGLAGIDFTFITGTKFEAGESIEVFIDTKTSGGINLRDETDYLITLHADGTVTINNWGGSNTDVDTSEIELTVIGEGSNDGATIHANIPYEFLGIQTTEIFGVSFGTKGFPTKGGDWDGWGFNGFIAPENPQNYVRVSPLNELYRANNNNATVTIDGTVNFNGSVLSGVKVEMGGSNVTTGSTGKYTFNAPFNNEDVTLTFSKNGYATQTVTITTAQLVDYKETVTLDMEEETTSIVGHVDGDLQGVQITIEGSDFSTVSDALGKFKIEGIKLTSNIVLNATLEGYSAYSKTITVQELVDTKPFTLEIIMASENQVVNVTGHALNVLGNVEGATVTVLGENITTTTLADGTFTLTGVPVKTVQVEFVKEGHVTQVITIEAAELAEGDVVMNDVDFLNNYGTTGKFSGKTKADLGNMDPIYGFVARGLTGFYFRFETATLFEANETKQETIELFIDTKESTTARNASDYLIGITSRGSVNINNWGGTNTNGSTITVDIDYTTIPGGTVVEVFIPYEFLGVEATETIGISLGEFSQFQGDWDGWGYGQFGFVAPENPTRYIRIGENNQLYAASSNEQ